MNKNTIEELKREHRRLQLMECKSEVALERIRAINSTLASYGIIMPSHAEKHVWPQEN